MLPLIFFIIAFFYATVGFGGGSSYLAVLSISGISYDLIPKIGLICNLLVVTGGCWHYYRKNYFNSKLILPFVLSSVPLSYLGGRFPLKEETFMIILATSLAAAGVRLLFVTKNDVDELRLPSFSISFLVGGALGLLSGMVALGGGIFLAPLMMNLKWGRPKEVAATASAFIFLNSASGLLGQFSKGFSSDIFDFWPLFVAVIIGGQLGSRVGTHNQVSQGVIQRGTAILILIISCTLFSNF